MKIGYKVEFISPKTQLVFTPGMAPAADDFVFNTISTTGVTSVEDSVGDFNVDMKEYK